MASQADRQVPLAELQRAFGEHVRGRGPASSETALAIAAGGPVTAADRLGVYRNNSWQFFRAALESTYPVLRKRVGDDYFRQLAAGYRLDHPSMSGDLHRVGQDFADWLASRLVNSGYEWLADLARLEWACEESYVAEQLPALPLQALASIAPESLEAVRFTLQPSIRLVESPYPIWSVWQSNQRDGPGEPVDLASGAERCAVHCGERGPAVYRLGPQDFRLVTALEAGCSLGEAVDDHAIDPNEIGGALAWAFEAGLVVALSPSARA